MQNEEVIFREDIYKEHLTTINGIKFTPRQIDVISCLVCMKGTKKIAELLSSHPKSVSPDTIRTHIQSIMQRVGCSSRDGIIDFIEKYHKLYILRDYYSSLVIEVAFEKSLNEISKLKREENPRSFIIYWQNQTLKKHLLSRLIIHLNQADIKAEVIEYTSDQKIETTENGAYIRLLLLNKEEAGEVLQELKGTNSVDLSRFQNYYFAVFEVLKRLIPKTDINKIFATFQESSGGLRDPSRRKMIWEKTLEKLESKESSSLDKILQIFQDSKWPLGVGIICISFLIMGCWVLRGKEEQLVASPSHQAASSKKDDSIRSDLVIPTESVLLNRPELISEIDNKLKSQKGIQTIALVGPGGAGKTTLARQYAHEQKAPVIWEVNAETIETLRLSFENLAQALAKTEGDRKTLKEVQDIKDSEAQREKLIEFVKKRLKSYSNWVLVYDNVEKFSYIQKYFPQDCATWGQGKIILTTRNNNIGNNKHINDILQIGELTSEQKVDFFRKITNHGNNVSFSRIMTKELKAFLEHIPPFPLDVSVAAYYLKTTNVSYPEYLENLKKYDKDFELVQKDLLKEAGDYTKTRYGIIIQSVQHIIASHKDFRDLLLFITLLDSQNIPRDLLEKHKSKSSVDNFIINLQKHSLIMKESSSPFLGSFFSIHRATQEICLSYFVKILKLEKINKSIHYISKSLEKYIDSATDNEDISKMNFVVSHVVKLSNNILLDNYNKSVIISALGKIFYYFGDFKKAEQLFEKSLSILKKCEIGNYHQIAQNLMYLGCVYREIGDYDKSKNCLEQSLIIYKKYFPTNQTEIAKILAFLGYTYKEMGNYKQAKNFFEKSFLIYKKYLPINHIEIAWVATFLGDIYNDIGNYSKAKQSLEQSLIIHERLLSEEHIRIAWISVLLGNVYNEMNNDKKAKDLLERGLSIYKKLLPENHTWVAWSLLSLGNFYKKHNNYKKAKNLFYHALNIYNFKKNYIEAARALSGLGQIYLLENCLGIAEQHLQKALRILQQNKQCDTYICLENLANLELKKSAFGKNRENTQQLEISKNKAVSYLKQALNIVETHFPKDSPHIIRIETKLRKLKEEDL